MHSPESLAHSGPTLGASASNATHYFLCLRMSSLTNAIAVEELFLRRQ